MEARNSTWREDDFAGHMTLYHPDFRRWALSAPVLMTKSDFAGFWNAFKRSEEVISLEVQPEEVVFYSDGDVAIAHYTIHETWKSARTEDIHTGSLRFSDVWVYVDGRWLYAGGHRDGMRLRRGQ